MKRLTALALVAAPLTAAALTPAIVSAQAASPLGQVQAHLRGVTTMTANFAQTDRRGQTLNGTITLKRPGRVRFQYGRGVPLLIVADGKALHVIDYQVKNVLRYPIGNSPLSVLLDPNKDLSKVAKVVQNTPQVLLLQARDRSRPEFGTITLAFAKVASAPGGLLLQGWNTIDAQNNRSTVKLTNQRFNVAVADTAFRWTDPRRKGGRG